MAEPKSPPAAAPSSGAAAASAAKPKPKITKMEAVRRALGKLGKDAKPLEIQPHIKAKYGIDMGTDHISTYKGDIARKKAKAAAAKQAALAGRAVAVKPSAAESARPRASNSSDSILLEDVLMAKALLDRVGAERLRLLIDGLAP